MPNVSFLKRQMVKTIKLYKKQVRCYFNGYQMPKKNGLKLLLQLES
jgi:hypothetical protein